MMFNVCPCQCSPLPLPLVNTQKKTAAPKGSPLPKAPARGRNFCWHVDMAGSLPRSRRPGNGNETSFWVGLAFLSFLGGWC